MNFNEMLTEFYARGFDYLHDNGAGTTRAKRWINQAYMDIVEADDWPWAQSSTTGVAPITISDLGTVESATNDTAGAPLVFIDRRSLLDSYTDLTVVGSATYAYLTNGTTVNSYPVSTDSLTVRYWKIPVELSSLTDSPLFPARYHYAIIDYACGRAYMDSDNPEMAQAARADGNALVQMMRERLLYQQHQDTDMIKSYGLSSDGYSSDGAL